jgi:hypothetical protein
VANSSAMNGHTKASYCDVVKGSWRGATRENGGGRGNGRAAMSPAQVGKRQSGHIALCSSAARSFHVERNPLARGTNHDSRVRESGRADHRWRGTLNMLIFVCTVPSRLFIKVES